MQETSLCLLNGIFPDGCQVLTWHVRVQLALQQNQRGIASGFTIQFKKGLFKQKKMLMKTATMTYLMSKDWLRENDQKLFTG